MRLLGILAPNPLESDTEYNRYYHHDLPGMDITALHDELYALRPMLWGLGPDDWLRERVRYLEYWIEQHQATGDHSPARPAPKRPRIEGVTV